MSTAIAFVLAATLSAASPQPPAEAELAPMAKCKPGQLGVGNGLRHNGIRKNGLELNGFHKNGLGINGWRLNGLGINGLRKNGVDETGNTAPARLAVVSVQLAGGETINVR